MNAREHSMEGRRALESFVNDSESVLNIIDEKLSFEHVFGDAYVRELGKRYRISNVEYEKGVPTRVDMRAKNEKVKDIENAHKAIERQLPNFPLFISICTSRFRQILGELESFDETRKSEFDKKFSTYRKEDSEIVDDAIDDFLKRFKSRFGGLAINSRPLKDLVDEEVKTKIRERKDVLLPQFRANIENNIGKDLFRNLVIYSNTLRKIIEIVRDVVGEHGAVISGRPSHPQEAAIKEIISEKIAKMDERELQQYREELERIRNAIVDNFRNNDFQALKSELHKEAKSAMETCKHDLDLHKDALFTEMKSSVLEFVKNQKEKLQKNQDTFIKQAGEELQKKVIDVTHRLDHLERKEYEITENLRSVSKFIQYHSDLNLSVMEYWKTLLTFAFTLHLEAKDAVIPERVETVWLDGINQTLEALKNITSDRGAERAMREGSKYERIPTTEADCQRIWVRFVTYLDDPHVEDIEYLIRRMNTYAADQNLKNVAIPAILYEKGILEFEKNYHSIDQKKEEEYGEKKRYFRAFFAMAYDEMIERFRGLILNMVV